MTVNRLTARDAAFVVACAATLAATARVTRRRREAVPVGVPARSATPNDAPVSPEATEKSEATETLRAGIAAYRAMLARNDDLEQGVIRGGMLGSLVVTFAILAALTYSLPTPVVFGGLGVWALIVVISCWGLYSIRRSTTAQRVQIMEDYGLTREQVAGRSPAPSAA